MSLATLRQRSTVSASIIDGAHDDELGYIIQAAQWRMKNLYRPGQRVRIKGTKNPVIDGREGTVIKVNQKRISVGLGEKDEWGGYPDGEYLIPPTMMEKAA